MVKRKRDVKLPNVIKKKFDKLLDVKTPSTKFKKTIPLETHEIKPSPEFAIFDPNEAYDKLIKEGASKGMAFSVISTVIKSFAKMAYEMQYEALMNSWKESSYSTSHQELVFFPNKLFKKYIDKGVSVEKAAEYVTEYIEDLTIRECELRKHIYMAIWTLRDIEENLEE